MGKSTDNVSLGRGGGKGKSFLFALPRFGTSVILGMEGFALFTLYSVAYQLDPFLTGLGQAMGYLAIAAAQFLFGWLSDAMPANRLGRRKPFIFIFSPLLGFSFMFLLLPGLFLPDLNNKSGLFVWLLIWDVIFRASYAVTTPYQAWMAEIFKVRARPKVSQLQNTFNFIGNGVMALLTFLVLTNVFDRIAEDVNLIPTEFMLSVIIFGIVVIVLFYIVGAFLPIEPLREIKSTPVQSLRIAMKNKNFLLVVFMQGLCGLAFSMISSVMLTYSEVVLDLGFLEYLIVAVALLLSIFVFLYLWRKLVETRGKKYTLLKIFISSVFFMPITVLGVIPIGSMLPLGLVFIIGIGALLGGWFLFPYLIYADIAEDDKRKAGEMRAGVYQGFPSIILNIFQAGGLLLLGAITSLPNIAVGTLTYSIGLVIWGPICSVILFLSWLYTKKYVKLDFEWEVVERRELSVAVRN